MQWVHHAESPDWWIRTECADNPSPCAPMPLERPPPPHFLAETLTKISISSIVERTFISFAVVALCVRVIGYDDDFWSVGASSLDIVHYFLLEPTDFWTTSWTRVHFWAVANLTWELFQEFVRPMQTYTITTMTDYVQIKLKNGGPTHKFNGNYSDTTVHLPLWPFHGLIIYSN